MVTFVTLTLTRNMAHMDIYVQKYQSKDDKIEKHVCFPAHCVSLSAMSTSYLMCSFVPLSECPAHS